MKRNIQKMLLVIWIAIILILTGFPTLETPKIEGFPLDKIYHFIIFFILGLLETRLLKTRYFLFLGLGVALIAECQQLFIPGREFEVLDIVAGMFGIIVVFFVFKTKRSVGNGVSEA